MYRQSTIGISIAMALALPASASANVFEDLEISGILKNETAFSVRDGQRTGQATSMLDDSRDHRGELFKLENTAKFFINGELDDDASWHAELNFVYETEGVTEDWRGHDSYTQQDYLRELYFDATAGDISFRVGKQQVVWGTADGIKLLDIINPTDFRELSQNSLEGSRLPIWMLNYRFRKS
jgi:hypothetical protein